MSQVSGGQSQNMAYTPQGASVFGVNNLSGVVTVVAPSSNVNGVVVRVVSVQTNNSAIALYADTGAPTSWNDATKRNFLAINTAGYDKTMIRDIFIPPGRGIYAAGSIGNSSSLWVNYDIL